MLEQFGSFSLEKEYDFIVVARSAPGASGEANLLTLGAFREMIAFHELFYSEVYALRDEL